jgi:hypothetical protein
MAKANTVFKMYLIVINYVSVAFDLLIGFLTESFIGFIYAYVVLTTNSAL